MLDRRLLTSLPRASRIALFVVAVSAIGVLLRWAAGRGSGQLVVWTDAPHGGALEVSLDGEIVGALREYFTVGTPPCDSGRGVVTGVFAAGEHQLTASDAGGRRWQIPVVVKANTCTLIRLDSARATPSSGDPAP